MVSRYSLLSLALLWCGILGVPESFADTQSRIGVLAFRGDEDALQRWTPTAEYLNQKTPGIHFTIVPLDLGEIGAAVENHQVDFVLTNTGNYVELEARYGISRIATLKNLRQGTGYTQFGAVIFTRADHPQIKTLRDLKGQRFAAVSADAFGGFQMAWREMLEQGIDPFSDLSGLDFLGFPQDNIVYEVLNGGTDAGTVRTDTMERMQQEGKIKMGDFRILNPQQTRGFPFVHSTRLYPEWPFAKARHTPENLAEHVAVALLNMPSDSEVARSARSAGWTIPLDYGSVHTMFQTLQIGPYEHLGHVTLQRLWAEYRDWILLLTATTLLLMAAVAWVLRVNRRMVLSEQALREEVQEREHAQRLLAAHRDSLEQRVAERTRELEQVNVALEQDIAARRQAEEALRRSDATLRAMHDITVAPADFEFKVKELLKLGCRHFGLTTSSLTRITDDGCIVLQAHAPDGTFNTGDKFSSHETFCAVVLKEGKPLSIPDIVTSDHQNHLFFETLGRRAYLGAPVIVEKTPYGTLNFSDRVAKAEPFPQVDIDILLLLAQWIGGEIEKIRAHERLQDHQVQLSRVARHNTMGEMASGIAHELNQPLTAIINYSRGCLRRIRGHDARKDLVQAIEKVSNEAERAGQIIKRLREFVTQGELRQESTRLEEMVRTVSELAAPELRRYNVQLVIDYAPDLPQIRVDRIQMEQVLLNLLRNAVDAVHANPIDQRRIEIDVGVSEPGIVSIKVQDNGPGIDEQRLAQVFDPFFTTKPEGMGLGLAISRSVVEAHRGKLQASSTPGFGTVFECRLPVGQAQVNEAPVAMVNAALGG